MKRADALKQLNANAPDDRLRAARSLSRCSERSDLATLESALSGETNKWVKSALSKAIRSVKGETEDANHFVGLEDEDERILEQIHAEAVEETTKRLVHEIRPILGRLELCAEKEISDYEGSETKKERDRLAQFLSFIDSLAKTASSPIFKEFDLAELIEETVASEKSDSVEIEVIGSRPQIIISDGSYIEIIFRNALRNAIEATETQPNKHPVVVSWGNTDVDYWVSIIDSGKGLPPSTNKIFEIGLTTKKDHFGVGLALVKQAALSIGGKISLSPRNPLGARFELRWPKIT